MAGEEQFCMNTWAKLGDIYFQDKQLMRLASSSSFSQKIFGEYFAAKIGELNFSMHFDVVDVEKAISEKPELHFLYQKPTLASIDFVHKNEFTKISSFRSASHALLSFLLETPKDYFLEKPEKKPLSKSMLKQSYRLHLRAENSHFLSVPVFDYSSDTNSFLFSFNDWYNNQGIKARLCIQKDYEKIKSAEVLLEELIKH